MAGLLIQGTCDWHAASNRTLSKRTETSRIGDATLTSTSAIVETTWVCKKCGREAITTSLPPRDECDAESVRAVMES